MLREPESARRYCGTGISFLSFCLKVLSHPSSKVPTRFTDRQRTALEGYKEYLMSESPASNGDVEKFESALSCILFRDTDMEIDKVGRLACPVQSYIALLSLRNTGEFVHPSLVTQPISRLLYLSRATVLRVTLRDHTDTDRFMRSGAFQSIQLTLLILTIPH